MLLDNINLNHIRIFECVYRTKSMTKAAEELHMTQSGVSQHIKLLEEILEVKLFDRIKQRLVATEGARGLFQQCSLGLYQIEQALVAIKGEEEYFSGKIKVGLPVEFGNNMVLPLISDFGKKYPKVKFSITYGFSQDINQALLSGEFDFAIVDDLPLDLQIKKVDVYHEKLPLVASRQYLLSKGLENIEDNVKGMRKIIESLDVIEYSHDKSIMAMWFRHHFKVAQPKLNVRATLMDVQGVAKMIQLGLGVGVIPYHHLVKIQSSSNPLQVILHGRPPLVNKIGLAYVDKKSRTPTVQAAIDHLLENLPDRLD